MSTTTTERPGRTRSQSRRLHSPTRTASPSGVFTTPFPVTSPIMGGDQTARRLNFGEGSGTQNQQDRAISPSVPPSETENRREDDQNIFENPILLQSVQNMTEEQMDELEQALAEHRRTITAQNARRNRLAEQQEAIRNNRGGNGPPDGDDDDNDDDDINRPNNRNNRNNRHN